VHWCDARRGDVRPVAISGSVQALLAGDRLQRGVSLLEGPASCSLYRARRRAGWVVVSLVLPRRAAPGTKSCFGSDRPAYSNQGFRVYAPNPASGG
jgi:hypothetical protein